MTEEKQTLLDIRHLSCPMTSVHVRLHLDQLPVGALTEVQLQGEETFQNVKRLLNTLQHHILIHQMLSQEHHIYRIIVRKNEARGHLNHRRNNASDAPRE